ncbi:MAG: hypothetical protein ACLS3V_00650 [Streptococcus sp.]
MGRSPFQSTQLPHSYLFRYSLHPEYTNLLIHQIRAQAFHQDFQAYPGMRTMVAYLLGTSGQPWTLSNLSRKPIYDLASLKKSFSIFPSKSSKFAPTHTAGAYFIQKPH